MSEIMKIIEEFKKPCPCGREHLTAVNDVRIGSGLVNEVGKILKENIFPKNILLVADKNTLEAAKGIEASLDSFNVKKKIYDNIRVADMKHVEELQGLIHGKNIAVFVIGIGDSQILCFFFCTNIFYSSILGYTLVLFVIGHFVLVIKSFDTIVADFFNYVVSFIGKSFCQQSAVLFVFSTAFYHIVIMITYPPGQYKHLPCCRS